MFDRDGVSLWGDVPIHPFGYFFYSPDVAISSTGDVFIGGEASSGIRVARVGLAGTLDWDRVATTGTFSGADQTRVLPNADGGCYVAWRQYAQSEHRTHVQRFDATGGTPWGSNGRVYDTGANGYALELLDDQSDGVVMVAKGNAGITIRRIAADGSLVWGPIQVAPSATIYQASAVSDGEGGAIVAWTDNGQGGGAYHAFIQRIDGEGTVEWQSTGVRLSATALGYTPRTAPDGSGGAFAAWADEAYSLHYDHVSPSGHPAIGSGGASISSAASFPQNLMVQPASNGSAWISWTTDQSPLLTCRVTVTGVAIGSEFAVPVSAPQVDTIRISKPATNPDGVGGIFLTWVQGENGIPDRPLVSRILPSGVPASFGGISVTVADLTDDEGVGSAPRFTALTPIALRIPACAATRSGGGSKAPLHSVSRSSDQHSIGRA
ncbi:MAG: hypothetical protein IPK72_08905 [Candidatus Eisenbacteria bacterium]|nr:hypothetical protein [Candidatus Eisenbacteria bacterium]